jgi:hypothetical protein
MPFDKPPKNKSGVVNVRDISPHIKAQFKAACARRGRSMRQVLEDFMMNYAAKDVPSANHTRNT